MIPTATYRLQFHKAFTFADAARQAGYFRRLGISHVYASPIQTARSGSTHGYDVVDHRHINPELGGEDGFLAMAGRLKADGLGIILDIVPNHMAVGGGDNAWWLDVLQNGPGSRYASWFDIDFDPPDAALKGKVHAPFLGAPYGEVLKSGDLKVERDPASGQLAVAYHHHRFPLRPEDQGLDETALAKLHEPDALHDLLERQHFRLAWWRTAGDRINWRRFFDITELAGLRVEQDDVFEAVHALPLDLYRRGLIDGLRVDHVDGLADPTAYCRKLRARLTALQGERPADASPGPAYLVVEKILGAGEELEPSWQVDGTTGYDFMNAVSALQHAPDGEAPLTELWQAISGRAGDFEEEEEPARDEILELGFDGALQAAARAFAAKAAERTETRDLSVGALRRAIIRIVRHLRVYRTYATGRPDTIAPDRHFQAAIEGARRAHGAEPLAIDFIAEVMAGDQAEEAARRFNHLTAPVTAKAVEDTAFYRYGRLLSRNDVGFEPGRFAQDVAAFHATMANRAKAMPHTMLATATHDHKRGEDVRARLAVLSEKPDLWAREVEDWFGLNDAVRPDGTAPDDEYQLYQTLVGAWPLDLRPDDTEGLAQFSERIWGWRQKSLREAKLRSSWTAPDEAYEAQAQSYLAALLDPQRSPDFLRRVSSFAMALAPAGAMNGLVQTVLRCTCPGMPDLFQGTEFWDFSLVDPDNRRPVDYAARDRALKDEPNPAALAEHWADGRLKQAVIAALLHLRQRQSDLMREGAYRPIDVRGTRAGHVVAFARERDSSSVLVIGAIRAAAGLQDNRLSPPGDWWGDTEVTLAGPARWRDALNGDTIDASGDVPVARLLSRLPVAVLTSD